MPFRLGLWLIIRAPAQAHTRLNGQFNSERRPVDIIYIRDLRIETVIGIFDWERKIKQAVVLDIEMPIIAFI